MSLVTIPKSIKLAIRRTVFQYFYRMMDQTFRSMMESTPNQKHQILSDHARVLADDIAVIVERWITQIVGGDCFFDDEES